MDALRGNVQDELTLFVYKSSTLLFLKEKNNLTLERGDLIPSVRLFRLFDFKQFDAAKIHFFREQNNARPN